MLAWTAILAQLTVLCYVVRNYHYVRVKLAKRDDLAFRPRTALIVPCKGIDARFTANLRSFLQQDYPNYDLFLVVGDEADPAYRELTALQAEAGPQSHPLSVQVLVAGPSRSSSQKIHNLLYALEHIPAECEVLAFADSDVCVRRDWLRHLVHPLYRSQCGVATGYRWFVPTQNNLATLALSAINAAVAQLLGNNPWNLAWGGSMAIRTKDFRRLGITERWSRTLSDDLSLSQAVKQEGLKITFVPACLVASFESFTWRRLYEFGRRQLLITRVYAPRTWWFGFLFSLGSVLGLWGAAAATIHAAVVQGEHVILYAAVWTVFVVGQIIRAALRQLAAGKILHEYLAQLLPAGAADVLGGWAWSLLLLVLLLCSAFGRTVRWRGIRYRLISPTQIRVFNGSAPDAG
ncbi:MAG: glycosyltransferase [Planctomycetes bacterium]|jgi:cellulose synthase/poly-beta-1,6-N-acetylglucosamine synthase-like glycosyltransferase|nr:glycosyltransferase [Planctomycetota bacterium]